MKKVLYIIEGYTGYKRVDENIIKSFAQIRTFNYVSKKDYFNINLLLNIIWSDVIIIWFASKHSLPALIINKLFMKPVYIIAGGFDVASVPKINYGAMIGGSRKQIGNWILSNATKVISVSKSNLNDILKNTSIKSSKIELIYNAVPKIPNLKFEKERQVLSVGEINRETFYRKGLDRYIAVAKSLCDVNFYHIGKWTDTKGNLDSSYFNYVKSIAPKNMIFLGYVNNNELIEYYKSSKVYIQLSRHEAFGVSVIEALSYQCVPVVTNCYSLPEIIDGNGYVVANIDEAIEKVKYALDIENFKVDQKLLEKYSISKRKQLFEKLIIK